MESKAEPNPPAGDLNAEQGSAAAPPPPLAPEPSLPREGAPPSAASSTPLPARPPSNVFLVVLTSLSLAADLVTKAWAKQNLSGFDSSKLRGLRRITLIKDHLDFIFAQNPGGAWSFLRSLPDTLRRPFFLVVSAAAVVFIVSMYQRLHPDQRAMKWGLPLALGGAMGNLVDRIRYGWVIDFIDVYLSRGGREHHWPTFNVADVAIVIGVGLMGISMLSYRGPQRAAAFKSEPSSAAVPPAA